MQATLCQSKPLTHSHARHWLLAYDIRDPKRLRRTWRILRKEGLPIQYSVFLIQVGRDQLECVLDKIRAVIDETADDVRAYPLTENTKIWGLGRQLDDDGNTLSHAFLDRIVQHESAQECQR